MPATVETPPLRPPSARAPLSGSDLCAPSQETVNRAVLDTQKTRECGTWQPGYPGLMPPPCRTLSVRESEPCDAPAADRAQLQRMADELSAQARKLQQREQRAEAQLRESQALMSVTEDRERRCARMLSCLEAREKDLQRRLLASGEGTREMAASLGERDRNLLEAEAALQSREAAIDQQARDLQDRQRELTRSEEEVRAQVARQKQREAQFARDAAAGGGGGGDGGLGDGGLGGAGLGSGGLGGGGLGSGGLGGGGLGSGGLGGGGLGSGGLGGGGLGGGVVGGVSLGRSEALARATAQLAAREAEISAREADITSREALLQTNRHDFEQQQRQFWHAAQHSAAPAPFREEPLVGCNMAKHFNSEIGTELSRRMSAKEKAKGPWSAFTRELMRGLATEAIKDSLSPRHALQANALARLREQAGTPGLTPVVRPLAAVTTPAYPFLGASAPLHPLPPFGIPVTADGSAGQPLRRGSSPSPNLSTMRATLSQALPSLPQQESALQHVAPPSDAVMPRNEAAATLQPAWSIISPVA